MATALTVDERRRPVSHVRDVVARSPKAATPRWWRQPGWPITAVFVGYPLWWVLGISQFLPLAAAIPMTAALIRRRRVETPRGFGLWLLFLAWVVVGVLVLRVSAPGAVAASSGTRYLTWAFRLAWYLTATIAMLYVGNLRKELPAMRIARSMSWMFVTITVGGVIGALAPHLGFPSLLELLLPRHIANIRFVSSFIHPTFAQLQDVLGYQAPRPSAPFTYSNVWGVNFACFLPFFVVAWCGRDAGWRRFVAPFILVLSLAAVIKSLNRGLWIALVVVVIFVALRSTLNGRLRQLGALLAAGAVVVALLAFSPLGTTISARLSGGTHNSNAGRLSLGTLTLTSVVQKSPVIGLGSTRQVQGNFNSISGGATTSCPHCSKPSLGTQGQVWLVVFSQGLLGLLFYVGFFVVQFLRHIRLRSRFVTTGLAVILAHIVTMPVYNTEGIVLLPILIAIGLIWREGVAAAERPSGNPLLASRYTLGRYSAVLRRHAVLVVLCTLLGTAGGAGWQFARGTSYVGSLSVALPVGIDYPGSPPPTLTIDSDGQLVSDEVVTNALSRAVGHPVPLDDNGITVTATPNSRVLHLAYSAKSNANATDGLNAAAQAYLRLRSQLLQSRQTTELRSLNAYETQLKTSITQLSRTLADLQRPAVGNPPPAADLTPLQAHLSSLGTELNTVDTQVTLVSDDPLNAGQIVRPATTKRENNSWLVAMASGLMLGFLLGVLVAFNRDGHGRRLRNRRRTAEATGLSVLADLSGADDDAQLGFVRAQHAASAPRGDGEPLAYLAADRASAAARSQAAALDRAGRARGPVVLVATPSTRARDVLIVRDRLARIGVRSGGIILVRGRRPTSAPRTGGDRPPASSG